MTSADKQPLKGKVVPARKSLGGIAASAVSGADALKSLETMVNGTIDYLRLREEEHTKRAKLGAYERTELRKIEAAEAVLKDYFRQAFDERKANVEALFDRYDAAVERGDSDAAHIALSGVVDLAKTSPLADLADLGQIRRALDDEKHVWTL